MQDLGIARLKFGFSSAEGVHRVQRWLSWPVECDHLHLATYLIIIPRLSYVLPSSEQRGKLACTSTAVTVGPLVGSLT